jgi:hypothetical protein
MAALVLTLMLGAIQTTLAAGLAPVNLGKASSFVILSKTGITNVPASKITGDMGVSPAAATYITGFALVPDRTGTFSTSTQVTGKIYAANYASPTPANLTTAVSNMQTAYTDAAGRPHGVGTYLNRGSGNIGGLTLTPGIYTWGSAVTIPKDLTLSGDKNAVWIFQISGTLNISSGKKVILKGGALAKNIFWQVSGATTLGTYSTFNGNILDQTNIAMQTGAVLNGRALAQTAVTLDHNVLVIPGK